MLSRGNAPSAQSAAALSMKDVPSQKATPAEDIAKPVITQEAGTSSIAAAPSTPQSKTMQSSTKERAAAKPQPEQAHDALSLKIAKPRLAQRPVVEAVTPNLNLSAMAPPLIAPLDLGSLESKPAEPVKPVESARAVTDRPSFKEAKLLSRVEPVYPAAAKQSHIQGTVKVNVTIGADGVPRSLNCVSGNPHLCQAASDAIRKWRYAPAETNGQPVEAQTSVSLVFQLN
jgi:protein TonB